MRWLARDDDSTLVLFDSKPTKVYGEWHTEDGPDYHAVKNGECLPVTLTVGVGCECLHRGRLAINYGMSMGLGAGVECGCDCHPPPTPTPDTAEFERRVPESYERERRILMEAEVDLANTQLSEKDERIAKYAAEMEALGDALAIARRDLEEARERYAIS